MHSQRRKVTNPKKVLLQINSVKNRPKILLICLLSSIYKQLKKNKKKIQNFHLEGNLTGYTAKRSWKCLNTNMTKCFLYGPEQVNQSGAPNSLWIIELEQVCAQWSKPISRQLVFSNNAASNCQHYFYKFSLKSLPKHLSGYKFSNQIYAEVQIL